MCIREGNYYIIYYLYIHVTMFESITINKYLLTKIKLDGDGGIDMFGNKHNDLVVVK